MLLQIALDCETAEQAFSVCDQVHGIVDIFEAGQLACCEGAKIVAELKKRYPDTPVVWDLKTNNFYTARPAIDFGADYVSLLHQALDTEFKDAIEYAHAHGSKVIGDMDYSRVDAERMVELEELGCDQISLQPNYIQDKEFVHDTIALQVAKTVVQHAEISVYGGITLENMDRVCALKPDILVVGAAIWKAEDPRAAAIAIKEAMGQYK